jgi:hypothetical protein
MRIQLKSFIILMGILAFMTSAQSCKNKKNEKNSNPNSHEVTIEDVIQSSQYTYLKVNEDDKDYWIAISRQEVKKGGTYYIGTGLEMKNFTSKELKRTFDVIFFVQDFSDQPIPDPKTKALAAMSGKKAAEKKEGINVKPAEGGITIAELFSNKDKYAGKTIKISGEVVKFNSGIMNKCWIHIQDGTEAEGSFDLTITAKDTVKVGDVVTFEGSISLDKDFGAGYTYDVIMEDAKLLTNL